MPDHTTVAAGVVLGSTANCLCWRTDRASSGPCQAGVVRHHKCQCSGPLHSRSGWNRFQKGSNVAGHGVVEGALEAVRFDRAPRLHQAVVPDVQSEAGGVRRGWWERRETSGESRSDVG